MKKQFAAFALAAAIGLAGCSAWVEPIENPQTYLTAGQYTTEEVRDAIIQSFEKRGWKIAKSEPGLIKAILRVRKHVAVVEVSYTNQEYSIKYVSSQNLKADKDTIHNKYNNWVHNIDVDIQRNLDGIR